MNKNVRTIRFYLGDKQENIDLICGFLEIIGFTQDSNTILWQDWMSKSSLAVSVFVSIHVVSKSFNLDNSGRVYCHKYSSSEDSSTVMLIDLLEAIPGHCSNPQPTTKPAPAPGAYPGPYCVCLRPNFIKNIAEGKKFDVCTICNKEKR